jgi:hypothetical protein
MSLNNYASLALTFFEVNLFSSFFKTDRTNQPTNQPTNAQSYRELVNATE